MAGSTPLGHPGCTPATLAGDQLELAADGPHQDRLQDAMLADRIRQLDERLLLVGEARLRGFGRMRLVGTSRICACVARDSIRETIPGARSVA
jgi:hypothetical protein